MGLVGSGGLSGGALLLAMALAMSGCSANDATPARDAAPAAAASTKTPSAAERPSDSAAEQPSVPASEAPPTQSPTESEGGAATETPAGTPEQTQAAPDQGAQEPTQATGPRPLDGTPRRALLSLPRIGIRNLVVVPYRGHPDDAPGTRIQDRGVAASPHGPRGGTGAGGVGNYIVTAHRTSSTQAFADLPLLRRGDRVRVVAGGKRLVYEIVRTRSTSFRSAASLKRQAAAVPGRPSVRPTKAMITLSTCATPEDHAAGNYWSDEFGNPEHRIDKVGVLVRTVPDKR